jgi:hypothetical protein
MKDHAEWTSYVNHLSAEHQHLHQTVQAVDAELRKDDVVFEKLVPPLEALADELSHHFAEEEAGGCLDEAVSVCPSLSPQAEQLKAEHAELRQAAECIVQKGKASASGLAQEGAAPDGTILELREMFADFARRLLTHEHTESGIMRQAFGIADNGESYDDVPLSNAIDNP